MVVYEFQKNSSERLLIRFTEYHGKSLIDLRVFFKVDGSGDEWKPTRKGIAMSIDHLPELHKGIEEAHKKWTKEKLS